MPNYLDIENSFIQNKQAISVHYEIWPNLARLSQEKEQTGLTKANAETENEMSYSRYDDRYWEHRINRALRDRTGFAWGAFFLGFILGGIIF